MKQSILKRQADHSPLLQQKRVQASGHTGKRKNLLFSLNLTTLIDAFCILVIFLLSNMNGQLQNIQIGKNMILPVSKQNDLMDQGLVVRLEKDGFSVDEKKLSTPEQLAQALIDAKVKNKEHSSIIIQADRQSDFSAISIILRAAGLAGFEKYMFAVLPGR